jgi:hypothetical protein
MSGFFLVRTAVATIVVLSLAGCAAGGSSADVDPSPIASVSPTAEAEPTPTTSAAPAAEPGANPSASPAPDEDPPEGHAAEPLKPGDVIDWVQLDRLSTTSYGYYLMRDGSLIVTRPLPATITADIQARIDAIGPDDPSDNGTSANTNFQSEQVLHAIVRTAGKEIVTVRLRRMAVPNADGTSGGFRWVASGSQSGWWMQWERERDVMVDKVSTWIDANDSDDRWIVAVGPGDAISPGQ